MIEIRHVDETTGAVMLKVECSPATVTEWAMLMQGLLVMIGFTQEQVKEHIRTDDDLEVLDVDELEEMTRIREIERENGYQTGFADGQAAKRVRK